MIEYALLVMLGFCAAGLLALLIAPTIWRRAVRLTTKRLDATLPKTLSDIEADKDLLRASYAMQIRRLEAGLNKARDKSASQLVEISRLQMVIGEFRDRAAALERQLEERSNAANVFERTIRKRFPELEAALAAAKAALDERAYEIADLGNSIRRREEALSLLQRSSNLQQAEIRTLREALEGSSTDKTGRFKKRPAQWTLEEFRSEYDRLHLELSKMREQLALAQEREVGQVAVLKTELQNLAEQIMSAAAAKEKQYAEQQRAADLPPPRNTALGSSQRPGRQSSAERPLAAPQPWPGRTAPAPARGPQAVAAPAAAPVRTQTTPSQSDTAPKPEEPRQPKSERTFIRPSERRPSITSEASSAGTKPETAALKTLLNRAAAVTPKAGGGDVAPVSAGSAAVQMTAQPVVRARDTTEPKAAAITERATIASPATAVRVDAEKAEPAASQPAAVPKPAEPNLDRMLREIFEGRGSGQPAAPAEPAQSAPPAAPSEPKAQPVPAEPSAKDKAAGNSGSEDDPEKKPSLLERLRVV